MKNKGPRRGDARTGENPKLQWTAAPGARRAAGLFVVAVGILYIFVLQGGSVEPKLEKTLRRMVALPHAWETRAKGPVCC